MSTLRRLLSAVAVAAAALSALFSVTLTAASSQPTHNSQLGVADLQQGTLAPFIQNWDCGCGPTRLTRQQARALGANVYPTRCYAENAPPASMKNYSPVDDRGVPYPSHTYPQNGFPTSYRGRTFPSVPRVPFPGWPSRVSATRATWNTTTRQNYRTDYLAQQGAIAPGLANPSSWIPSPHHGWEWWQIHHIHERVYGGGNGANDEANLVPMFSYPNSRSGGGTNLHNNYTQWWNNITLDQDVRDNPPPANTNNDPLAQQRFDLYTALQQEWAQGKLP